MSNIRKITIKWGERGEETKTYSFKSLKELEAFKNGVQESQGWFDYEILRYETLSPSLIKSLPDDFPSEQLFYRELKEKDK